MGFNHQFPKSLDVASLVQTEQSKASSECHLPCGESSRVPPVCPVREFQLLPYTLPQNGVQHLLSAGCLRGSLGHHYLLLFQHPLGDFKEIQGFGW
ncbi:hypothetical protein CDAR_573401 [Caerostris darwini]|uniref:Uncharacterized protein n=1 Tax=Caerostris darwini TaxID=1538125 RepID=A0AAV4VPW0_9ARAC|nr:hypothetical protein CDAR_573401 [Caerostris darwini]